MRRALPKTGRFPGIKRCPARFRLFRPGCSAWLFAPIGLWRVPPSGDWLRGKELNLVLPAYEAGGLPAPSTRETSNPSEDSTNPQWAWSGQPGSNRRPRLWQSRVPPTELCPRPATARVRRRLNHIPELLKSIAGFPAAIPTGTASYSWGPEMKKARFLSVPGLLLEPQSSDCARAT